MSESMVERVARAIYEKRNGAGCMPWAHRQNSHKDPYRSDARAAIEAMREPTEGMRAARFRNLGNGGQAQWEAMIDAALSEQEPKP